MCHTIDFEPVNSRKKLIKCEYCNFSVPRNDLLDHQISSPSCLNSQIKELKTEAKLLKRSMKTHSEETALALDSLNSEYNATGSEILN